MRFSWPIYLQKNKISIYFYSDELKGLSYDSPDTPYSDHKMVVWQGYKK